MRREIKGRRSRREKKGRRSQMIGYLFVLIKQGAFN